MYYNWLTSHTTSHPMSVQRSIFEMMRFILEIATIARFRTNLSYESRTRPAIELVAIGNV